MSFTFHITNLCHSWFLNIGNRYLRTILSNLGLSLKEQIKDINEYWDPDDYADLLLITPASRSAVKSWPFIINSYILNVSFFFKIRNDFWLKCCRPNKEFMTLLHSNYVKFSHIYLMIISIIIAIIKYIMFFNCLEGELPNMRPSLLKVLCAWRTRTSSYITVKISKSRN